MAPQILQKISDLMKPHRGFRRSVQIDHDFGDSKSTKDFVVTDFIEDAYSRIRPAFEKGSTQRAWRLTGDYGSGKSAFALSLLKGACGKGSEIPKQLRMSRENKLTPIIVIGDRESLILSIGRALINQIPEFHGKSLPANNDELVKLAKEATRLTGGIFLVIDELGKNLEHAIADPDSSDVFTLQRLAEFSDRSGKAPFVLLIILHMGISAYTLELDSNTRQEWEKVAGRFNELHYHHPFEQTIQICTKALGLNTSKLPLYLSEEASASMEWCAEQGYFGTASSSFLHTQAPAIFPLHPTALAPLVAFLRRFGQNERSLFNFLTGNEPYALQELTSLLIEEAQFYDLSHLYSYVKSSLAPALVNGKAAHWRVIESVVRQANDSVEESILKITGLLNLLDDDRLVASQEFVLRATTVNGVSAPKIKEAFSGLQKRHLLFKRGARSGFALWPHASVHLDDEFERVKHELGDPREPMQVVSAMLDPVHIVARRHYIETGNLRHFELQFLPASELEALVEKGPRAQLGEADGYMIVLLPKSQREFNWARKQLPYLSKKLNKTVLVSLTAPPTKLLSLSLTLQTWKQVAKTVTDLAFDDYARAELNRQLRTAELRLEDMINEFVGLDGRPNKLAWLRKGRSVNCTAKAPISSILSEVCDQLYKDCPRIVNELINRRVSSSAGSRARTALAGRLSSFPHEELLGMDKSKNPPEMSIYLSVLKAGNIHVKDHKAANWRIEFPPNGHHDPCRLLPSFRTIEHMLKAQEGARITIDRIIAKLKAPPIGAREGVIPLILAVYLAATTHSTAVYEDETYIHAIDSEVMQRMAKEPECFEFQYCAVEGVKIEVFQAITRLFGVQKRNTPAVLDVVKPLMTFISSVPEYARNTKKVSDKAKALRTALLGARDPSALVFKQIPELLAVNVHDSKAIGKELAALVSEIQGCYDLLLDRISQSIQDAFATATPISEFRQELVARCNRMFYNLAEGDLRSFVNRLGDDTLEYRKWLESLANHLARKSSSRWNDFNEETFHNKLAHMAKRMLRAEAAQVDLVKEGIRRDSVRAVRLALTKPDGSEYKELMHWSKKEEAQVGTLEAQLVDLISKNGRVGMAAAVKALWSQLEDRL